MQKLYVNITNYYKGMFVSLYYLIHFSTVINYIILPILPHPPPLPAPSIIQFFEELLSQKFDFTFVSSKYGSELVIFSYCKICKGISQFTEKDLWFFVHYKVVKCIHIHVVSVTTHNHLLKPNPPKNIFLYYI